jgi:hypothetical protein
MRRFSLCLGLLVACGGTASLPSEVAAPAADDAAFTVSETPGWLLIGNALTPGDDRLSLTVDPPASVEEIYAYFDDGRAPVALVRDGVAFRLEADVSTLAPGPHRVVLAADRSDTGFAVRELVRSHPLYVVVSVDWDRANCSDDQLALHVNLHEAHSELKITHFIGPNTFTADLPPERKAELVAWAIGMREDWGDELGLHIHPFCHFVTTTDVACRTEPSFSDAKPDESGYSVYLSAYAEQELTTLLERADELFVEAGFGKPTSFRAGGWTAELHTLRALVNAGYLVDSSANNWARMEEWSDNADASLYAWNKEHWATIDDTSQPYYPSADDILSSAAPQLPILEVPDNGILVDYVLGEEMVEVFDKNLDPAGLAAPTVYQIGWHCNNFSTGYAQRIAMALGHVDQHRASTGQGPVVYVSISELVIVFPPTASP